MANKIVEKYFDYSKKQRDLKVIKSKVIKETGFKIQKEIFRGQIYKTNKVGSLIYKGRYQNQLAVLKIQILELEQDEAVIIRKFNQQNRSKIIRTEKLFKTKKWNKKDGYGYLIKEFIDGEEIYSDYPATQAEKKEYLTFYQEYKTKCLNRPLLKIEEDEKNAMIYTFQRVAYWTKIAQEKNNLSKKEEKYLEKYCQIASQILPNIRMEFCHGHLAPSDTQVLANGEIVFMSNLFWSWRPEFYDTTFHLWASIKAIRDLSVAPNQVINYIKTWIRDYKKLPCCKKDIDFETKFKVMMLERCVGAFLIDLDNQHYASNKQKHLTHLYKIFFSLFNWLAKELKKW